MKKQPTPAQQDGPLFFCGLCVDQGHEGTCHRPGDLRAWDGNQICKDCYEWAAEEVQGDDAPDTPPWAELPPFVPPHETRIAELEGELAEIRCLRDEDALFAERATEQIRFFKHRALAADLADIHAQWSDENFGSVGPIGPLRHLIKEAEEAIASPEDPHEYADCLMLVLDAARRAGFPFPDLIDAAVEKMEILKGRTYPKPKDGEPAFHIKESSSQEGNHG